MAKEIQDPDEAALRCYAKQLGNSKKEVMALSRSLMVGQAASIAVEATRLANEAGEAIKSSREVIRAALRGLGAASDISEASGPTRAQRPPPSRPVMGDLDPDWAAGPRAAASGWPPNCTPANAAWPLPDSVPRPRIGGAGRELSTLMRSLMGAQANDSGWMYICIIIIIGMNVVDNLNSVIANSHPLPQKKGENMTHLVSICEDNSLQSSFVSCG
jgi:hypothetical protein